MSGINASEIRELIDRVFALQWCRENIVTPLRIINTKDTDGDCMLVAIGNYSYLGTIGDFIKHRLADAGLSCQFIEKPPELIQQILDSACDQRSMPESNTEATINDESIIDALRDADESGSVEEYDYDFDDSDEEIIEENLVKQEMLGTKIQQAAAKF